jgi:hypothetical protein
VSDPEEPRQGYTTPGLEYRDPRPISDELVAGWRGPLYQSGPDRDAARGRPLTTSEMVARQKLHDTIEQRRRDEDLFSRMTTPVCPECFAFVGNEEYHARWHRGEAIGRRERTVSFTERMEHAAERAYTADPPPE